ncbi:MAG TPA: hypothetical protein VFD03_00900 [Clostridia bacterium]|nr:hypothetical protein [Clostridia bacterium]
MIMMVGEFLQQFYMLRSHERIANLDSMITTFSEAIGESERSIAAGAFILSVLSVCWSYNAFVRSASLPQKLNDCGIFLDQVKIYI